MTGEQRDEVERDEAEIIAFPTPVPNISVTQPNCWDCKNSSVGPPGTYCHIFDEFILTELTTALDCPAYEDPDE